mmetsp:Transcript_6007/g.10813  ORF Transcript_6007/g.10813 Transcript_6007/m.10813 type:complete len:236 (+) Transcript_6007:269-976(+)
MHASLTDLTEPASCDMVSMAKTTFLARHVLRILSPCPVVLTHPTSLAKPPLPAMGESPTRPTRFSVIPPVLVAHAKFPHWSIATAPTVSCSDWGSLPPTATRRLLNNVFTAWLYCRNLSYSANDSLDTNCSRVTISTCISSANLVAPAPTNKQWSVFSITSLATLTGFLTFCTAATAPYFKVLPSMTMASISTSPALFKHEPVPASNAGLSSNEHTASITASKAGLPSKRALYPR